MAVGAQDPHLLYRALDSDSRWAVDSVWRYHREIAKIVAEKFPPGARERELKRVERATRAGSPEELFAAFAATRGDPFAPLGDSAEALGTFARLEGNTVVTSTGRVVPLTKDPDGGWGYAAYHDELVAWRGAAANDLKRIQEDLARQDHP